MATRTLQAPSSSMRNVHLYDDSGQIIGGVCQNGSITNRNFIGMCEIFLRFPDSPKRWYIYELSADGSTGNRVHRSKRPLRTGRYIVLGPRATPVPVTFTTTGSLRRVLSRSGPTSKLTPQRRHFRDIVRSRDLVCSVTGITVGDGSFTVLHAAHIFPLAHEAIWKRNGYGHSWVTDTSPPDKISVSRINSPQNGLLLRLDLHHSFILYVWAINPYDDYKITWFVPGNNLGLDGLRLRDSALTLTNHNIRVSDRALYWHFEQAVLKNMRGAAKEQWPDWEHDLGEGEDIIGTIMEGPNAGERMELELATRLGAGDDVDAG